MFIKKTPVIPFLCEAEITCALWSFVMTTLVVRYVKLCTDLVVIRYMLPTKYVHGVHDFVSFGDQTANAEKIITPHTRHQGLILVCISYRQMGNTFAR